MVGSCTSQDVAGSGTLVKDSLAFGRDRVKRGITGFTFEHRNYSWSNDKKIGFASR
jgi:hypothetical protein